MRRRCTPSATSCRRGWCGSAHGRPSADLCRVRSAPCRASRRDASPPASGNRRRGSLHVDRHGRARGSGVARLGRRARQPDRGRAARARTCGLGSGAGDAAAASGGADGERERPSSATRTSGAGEGRSNDELPVFIPERLPSLQTSLHTDTVRRFPPFCTPRSGRVGGPRAAALRGPRYLLRPRPSPASRPGGSLRRSGRTHGSPPRSTAWSCRRHRCSRCGPAPLEFEAPICVAELSAAAIWWTPTTDRAPARPSRRGTSIRRTASACRSASARRVRRVGARRGLVLLREASVVAVTRDPDRVGRVADDAPPHPHSDSAGNWLADDAASAACQIDES